MASDGSVSGVSDLGSGSESDDDVKGTSSARKTPKKIKESESDEKHWKPFTPVKNLSHSDAEGSDTGDHSDLEAESEEVYALRTPGKGEDLDSPIRPIKRHRQSKASLKLIYSSDSDEEEQHVKQICATPEECESQLLPKVAPKKKLKLKGPRCKWRVKEDVESPSTELSDAKLNLDCVVTLKTMRC